MLKLKFTWFIVSLATCLILASCDTPNNNTAPQSISKSDSFDITNNNTAPQSISKSDSFDTTNKDINLNGNLQTAVRKINNMENHTTWNDAQDITAEDVTKSPYSALGKPYRMSGEVYKSEELPPNRFNGQWSEILLLTKNPNSPLGVTTIDYIFKGTPTNVKSGKIITCSGLFIGTFESSNAMGGKVEAVVLVGNELRIK